MIFTHYFFFFQVASATATRYGLSRGLLGLEYDRINISDSDSGGGGWRGVCQHQSFQNSIASQPLIIYFNYPMSDCSTLLIMLFVIVLH